MRGAVPDFCIACKNAPGVELRLVTDRDNDCPGLRERKRRETRLRIEDCGTELILERGFDQVTLEEICDRAGVSRRTFFNYFDSKDQVASGTGLPALRPEDLKSFATADSGNVVRDILRFLGERIDSDPDTSLTLSPDRETSLRIKARRRIIISRTPHLMLAGMRRFDELAGAVLEAITANLTEFPERRRAPHLDAHEEATLLTAFIRQCLITAPLIHRNEESSRTESLHRAGRDLIQLAAAYADGWD
ncbi:hypothetical protein Csp1_09620 [Corynebacterium provencense]|uniref:HTH tetR-type domain-containing protein n=1 Tax=Corynebacterium provencense TaxID=1737425 RepID=A0A2Z3YNC3_9CORY|nr:hypothetical protein Csp1_09620 [Corynebacterium provencense]